MAKRQKVYPGQVTDLLKENGKPIPVQQIAETLGCSAQTIRKRLKELRKEDARVLSTAKGIWLPTLIDNKDDAELTAAWAAWVAASIRGSASQAVVGKTFLAQAKRILQKSYTKSGLQTLRTNLIVFKNAIDLLQIEYDDDEAKK